MLFSNVAASGTSPGAGMAPEMNDRVEPLVPVIQAEDNVHNLPVIAQVHDGEVWTPVCPSGPG